MKTGARARGRERGGMGALIAEQNWMRGLVPTYIVSRLLKANTRKQA
jgi:hypothetical protein